MRTTEKPKRVSVNCSLPPELAARLQRECNTRLLNASVLVEKAVEMLFASFDGDHDRVQPDSQ